jgi:hypothetical protein
MLFVAFLLLGRLRCRFAQNISYIKTSMRGARAVCPTPKDGPVLKEDRLVLCYYTYYVT